MFNFTLNLNGSTFSLSINHGSVVQTSATSTVSTSVPTSEPMETDHTYTVAERFNRQLRKVKIQSTFYPKRIDSVVDAIYDALDKDCRALHHCHFENLALKNVDDFIIQRLTARLYCRSCTLYKALYKNDLLNESRILGALSDFSMRAERAILGYLQSPFCEKTGNNNVFFRAGKFSCSKDEMGRVINSVLKREIFDPSTINQKAKKYGAGLYTTPSLYAAMAYLQQPYNQNQPVVILAVHIKPDIPILDFNGNFSRFLRHHEPFNHNEIVQEIFSDNCHLPNLIYRIGTAHTSCGYTLIKSPSSIDKVEAYDYTMLTKIHTPFDSEMISQHKMVAKTANPTRFIECIGNYLIETNDKANRHFLPVYRYEACYSDDGLELAIRKYVAYHPHIRHPPKKNNIFFSFINKRAYEVRPSARCYEQSIEFSNPTFHVQYTA